MFIPRVLHGAWVVLAKNANSDSDPANIEALTTAAVTGGVIGTGETARSSAGSQGMQRV